MHAQRTRPRTDRIEVAAEGCRCSVCRGRADDPQGIHGHRGDAATTMYRIQPMLPISIVFADGSCVEAHFTVYDGKPCVEALVRLGTIPGPYTIVLTIPQALAADIIERV